MYTSYRWDLSRLVWTRARYLSADRALTAGCHRNNIPTRAQLASAASGEKTKSRASLLKWPPLPTPKKKRKPSDEDFFRCSRYQCCCCCYCNCRYSSHPTQQNGRKINEKCAR